VVVIRQATLDDAPAIGRVRATTWRATYRGIVPDPFLDAIDPVRWGERQQEWMLNAPDGHIDLVAEADEQVVGWAAGGPNRDGNAGGGELYAIYILPGQQRRSIGLRLTRAVARHLHSRGFRSMIVWVLADNLPARRFYEALGGKPDQERLEGVGGVRLTEVSYGWDALGSLTGSPPRPAGS
jgi:ribosomal protein S18 acetylase RimI-like enzyme